MESIQSQRCATWPRSPSISGLSSGKPVPPSVLRERLGSGGQGSGRQQEGVTQSERADQSAAHPSPRLSHHLHTLRTQSSQVRDAETSSRATDQKQHALGMQRARVSCLSACTAGEHGRNKCRPFLCKSTTKSVLTSTYLFRRINMLSKRYSVSRRGFKVWNRCPHLKIGIWLMKMKASCFSRTIDRSGRVKAESPHGDHERGRRGSASFRRERVLWVTAHPPHPAHPPAGILQWLNYLPRPVFLTMSCIRQHLIY